MCFGSHKVPTADLIKTLKIWGAGGFLGPAMKNGRNHGPARLRLKMVKIQKFLMTLVFATLWLTDGQKSNFFSDLPYESQGALCERPQNSLFQPQNLNCSPQHWVSPQIPTYGLIIGHPLDRYYWWCYHTCSVQNIKSLINFLGFLSF